MPSEPSRPSLAGLDPELQLEILGQRDTILGQKVTIANLEWRLLEAERQSRRTARERDAMASSATWRIGRLVMTLLWPLRKVRSVLRRRSQKPA